MKCFASSPDGAQRAPPKSAGLPLRAADGPAASREPAEVVDAVGHVRVPLVVDDHVVRQALPAGLRLRERPRTQAVRVPARRTLAPQTIR